MKQTVVLCDLHLGANLPATQTIQLGYSKKIFALDVCDDHKHEIDDQMQTLLAAAHNAQPGKRRSSGQRSDPLNGPKSSVVRAWAREVGIPIGSSGAVSREIRMAYEEALARPPKKRVPLRK